jgi:hypothetical protein
MSINPLSSHSAEVEMWLDCGTYGKAELSRITPNSVVLRSQLIAPPCRGRLIVRIDGRESTRVVHVSGLSANRLAAKIRPINDVAPF